MGRASNLIRRSPDETQQIMLKFFDRTPADVMKAIVGNIRSALAEDGRFTEEMWKNANEFNMSAGKIKTPVDTREGVLWTNAYNTGR